LTAAWPLLVASLVVGLAGLVRLADPAATGADDLTGVIRLPASLTSAIAVIVTLAVVVFFLGIARALRARRQGEGELGPLESEPVRRPWLHVLAQILSFVNVLVLGYLLWKNALPFGGLLGLGGGGAADGALLGSPQPEAPWVVTWTFAALALIAAATMLALAMWFASGDRLAEWWSREDGEEEPPPPALVEAVDDGMEDLRGESDARRAIIRCYARFERAAAASGFARRPWQTPMEFMREALGHLPGPRAAVRALTSLFELARFSDRALGAGERDRALDALDDIKAAIDAAR